jgi:hypothetical protein
MAWSALDCSVGSAPLGKPTKFDGERAQLGRLCTELCGASDDVFGRVKPKKFDGEPARRHFWTHRGGLGP